MTSSPIDLCKLHKAIGSLKAALFPPPLNDRERDGAIQRFEYTFELCWKSAKRVLEKNGVIAQSPREIFRELANKDWIANPEAWFRFLEGRNKTNHIYEEEMATEVFKIAKEFFPESEKLFEILKKKANDSA